MKKYFYRLVVGEKGNEQGHLVACKAQTPLGARIALGQQLARYKGGGWGYVQAEQPNGDWARL